MCFSEWEWLGRCFSSSPRPYRPPSRFVSVLAPLASWPSLLPSCSSLFPGDLTGMPNAHHIQNAYHTGTWLHLCFLRSMHPPCLCQFVEGMALNAVSTAQASIGCFGLSAWLRLEMSPAWSHPDPLWSMLKHQRHNEGVQGARTGKRRTQDQAYAGVLQYQLQHDGDDRLLCKWIIKSSSIAHPNKRLGILQLRLCLLLTPTFIKYMDRPFCSWQA